MLLLSCERGQKVVIGCEGIAVAVMEVRGDRVRLGISAPASWEVHRQEIWQQPDQPRPPPEGATTPAASLLPPPSRTRPTGIPLCETRFPMRRWPLHTLRPEPPVRRARPLLDWPAAGPRSPQTVRSKP